MRAPHSGTAVYLRMLCQELAGTGAVELVEVANPRRGARAGGGLGSLRNLALDEWWTAVELPRLAAKKGAQAIHHALPARSRGSRLPQLITVHDLSFERLPDCFDRRFRLYAHLWHRAAARSAAAVICVSQTTAADVRELWGVDDHRIVLARHGPGQPLPAPKPGTTSQPGHFLYVGDQEPRKNLTTLLTAYQLYRDGTDQPLPLVLAGSASATGPGIRPEPQPTAQRLADLYASAACLIHPSLYEGFGLTVLEAMSAGAPVLAARSPGVLEIAGEAVRLAEATDPREFARAMAELAGDHALRRDLADRGRRRASEFSWARCATAHVNAYSLALRQA